MLVTGISTVRHHSANKIPELRLTRTAIILYNDREHGLAEDLVHRMVKRAIEMEGTATGEHGVGLVKRDYLEHEVGRTTVDLMRKVSLESTSPARFSSGGPRPQVAAPLLLSHFPPSRLTCSNLDEACL